MNFKNLNQNQISAIVMIPLGLWLITIPHICKFALDAAMSMPDYPDKLRLVVIPEFMFIAAFVMGAFVCLMACGILCVDFIKNIQTKMIFVKICTIICGFVLAIGMGIPNIWAFSMGGTGFIAGAGVIFGIIKLPGDVKNGDRASIGCEK